MSSNHGGVREGAGRPSKANEDKAQARLLRAIKTAYSQSNDEDAINDFLVKFVATKEGMKFFAEHLIGKPKDKPTFDLSDDVESVTINYIKPSDKG
jgi:hypothetical protein